VNSDATLNINGVTLASPSTLTLSGTGVGGAGALTGTGNAGYDGTLALAGNTTLGADSGATLTLGGALDQPTGSNYAVRKAGPGTVVLNNASSDYSGGTTIDAGTLRLGAANLLHGPVSFSTSTAATLDLNNFAQTIGTLSGGTTGSQIALGSAALTVTQNTAGTFDGAITGSGRLIKDGSATLTLRRAL
jgi:autotransporter-associated beta strand protein